VRVLKVPSYRHVKSYQQPVHRRGDASGQQTSRKVRRAYENAEPLGTGEIKVEVKRNTMVHPSH
jgi:hypothetical protein